MNTEESNSGGEAISGAIGTGFMLPRTLAAGTHYYYCLVSAEGADPVATQVAVVEVVPASGSVTEAQVADLQQLKDAIAGAPADGTEAAIEVTASIQLDGELAIDAGKNIKLWSQAAVTLKAMENTRLFTLRGSLTLENHITLEGTGNVEDNGGGILVAGGNLTMNGGQIAGVSARAFKCVGGGVYVDGTFTMNGGKISGCNSVNGSGVYVGPGSSFVMTGGEISGNIEASCGTVYLDSASFVMDGGEISGNTANVGGGIYATGSASTLTLNAGRINGNMSVLRGSVYLEYGQMTMNGGEISDGTTDYDSGGVYLIYGAAFEMNDGKICGITGAGVEVRLDSTFTLKGGEISGNASRVGGGGGVYASGTFIMEGGTICNNTGGNGGGVSVHSSGSFAMSGGTISGNRATQNGMGGGVYLLGQGAFTMTGGEISGNEGVWGGGIYGHDITLVDGKITGNTANYGGGLRATGQFTMSGGEISGNTTTASQSGGAGVSASRFTMDGGVIKNNTAKGSLSNGGGASVGTMFIMNGGEISGNTATLAGGGVNLSGEGVINAGTISGNKSSFSGGGAYIWLGTLTMKGGTISGNTAGKNGGGVCSYDATFTLSAGTISGNKAEFGGGVSSGDGWRQVYSGAPQHGSKVVLRGGTVSDNTATGYGGGLYVRTSESRNVDGTINGICYGEGTIAGGTVSGNTSAMGGDSIYVNSGTAAMSGGTVSGTATDNGSVCVAEGSFTISGGFLFVHGSGSGVVILAPEGAFTATGGVVCSWARPAGSAPYSAGTSVNLTSEPAGAAVWAREGGSGGIRYKNGATAGFFPLDVTVVDDAEETVVLAPPAGYTGTTVYLDGVACTAAMENGRMVIEAPAGEPAAAVMYKYNDAGVATGMYVWELAYEDGLCTAQPVPELEDLLSYHGFSVRITGKAGIRFKTGISANTRSALASAGLAGYTLKEYGTLVMSSADKDKFPLVKGQPGVIGGMAYGTDANGKSMDAVFELVDGRYRFTSVLVGLPASLYKNDFIFRGYIVLSKDGDEVILYGPPVGKNIYQIAGQALGTGLYKEGTAAHTFLTKLRDDADAALPG